jgi:ABC-2 type transport system permease protein
MAQYSNIRAMRSLVKASLQAILKSPSAIIFTIAFPLIFILVFGFLGNSPGFSIRVASKPGSDTTSQLYAVLHQLPVLKWADKDSAGVAKLLKQGDIVATIDIQKQPDGVKPEYKIVLDAASTEVQKAQQLQNMLTGIIQGQDAEIRKRQDELVRIDMHVSQVRDYKTIDFILPGQLSFSLLASGVFGTAFVFFNLRQTLVLKRFFATPVRKDIIVISEGLARMVFQMLGTVIIISLGHFVFGFTLYHGFITFLEILLVCSIALLVFMGFGFVISGIAKSESAIPPFSNLITLPQFLLAGTFFPIDNFPKWMQGFCNLLPLTYLNDALRKISFDGASLWEVHTDILALLVWGVIIYAIAGKTFKWE